MATGANFSGGGVGCGGYRSPPQPQQHQFQQNIPATPPATVLNGKIESMIAQGRRSSAASIIQRLRSGSISGWAGQHFSNPFKTAHFSSDAEPTTHTDNFLQARLRRMSVDPSVWRQHGNASLGSVLSALYAKLLVVMGIAFPMSEVISTYVPPAYYDGFYLYLYFVSILFMGWLFTDVIKQQAKREITKGVASLKSRLNTNSNKSSVNDEQKSDVEDDDDEDENELNELSVVTEANPFLENHDTNSEDSDDKLAPLPVQNRASPVSPSSGPTLQPINHHLHNHHNLHVTINSAPGHDVPCHVPLTRNNIKLKQNGKLSDCGSKGKLSRTQSLESSKYDGYGGRRSHFGSFYLRMGAVAFGVGSMIYSCLEFGQFLEQEPDTKCHSYMQAITPVVRIIFTFMQMYFIFLNSRMSVSKVSWVKQFGLMHLIGTNLCVWLNVLVQETKHEILHFYDPENGTITVGYGLKFYGKSKMLEEHAKVVAAASNSIAAALIADPRDFSGDDNNDMLNVLNASENAWNDTDTVLRRLRRGLKGPHSIYECARENIMGHLVNSASPFLFPCTIEYSLICAAICYVMFRSMAKRRVRQITLKKLENSMSQPQPFETRNVHHYTVDCAGSNKGLFIGIFFLVFTIMSLILNFVLMKHSEHLEFAFWEVNLTEITLYAVSTLAVLIGMMQMRQLRYESGGNLELDNILLIVAQSGSFMFNVFCIVGGHLTPLESNVWILITPLLCLIQLLLQTLFILDASKRVVSTPELARRKPGREIVTFLLVTNLAMWLINALEKSRGDSHPHLLRFYGVWAWTIITDISMPLAIFYRFHSTVCLCEIWKKAYKARKFDRVIV